MSASSTATDATDVASMSLVSLLGPSRAAVVEFLHGRGDASIGELARHLEVSEVATRRHVGVLESEGLVLAQTVRQGRGRPAARYRLTDRAQRLFPQRYDRFAAEVMEFLADEHGRDGLQAFLRWRLEREVAGLKDAVTAEDLHGRLQQLAEALSDAGFEASVVEDGDGFTLTQEHCAIADVAARHPEVCHYEAAAFAQVLGGDMRLSRRETLAAGGTACVCRVSRRTSATDDPHAAAAPRPRQEHDLIDEYDSDVSTRQTGRGDDL